MNSIIIKILKKFTKRKGFLKFEDQCKKIKKGEFNYEKK